MRSRVYLLGLYVCLGVFLFCGFGIGSPAGLGRSLNLHPVKKKLIATGWEFSWLRPGDLQGIMNSLKDGPFDGVIINFNVRGSKNEECAKDTVAAGQTWRKDWFLEDIAALKAAKSPVLTDNFLMTWICPRASVSGSKFARMAWDDDARWASFVNNMGILAWVAKQGGLKGLVLDPEDYDKSQQYSLQSSDGDYEATAKLARLRGAQLMTAMGKEYSDITLLAFLLFSYKSNLSTSIDPDAALRENNDLWIPFINGMLDAAPPQTRLVDATELGYAYTDLDFPLQTERTKIDYQNLVATENRAKFRAQYLAGAGLYMECYFNPEGNLWYQPPLHGSRMNRLSQNVIDALATSDEYVWLYGENGRWCDYKPLAGAGSKDKLWEEQMLGVTAELKFAKNPDVEGKKLVEAARRNGKLKNMIVNADFQQRVKPDDLMPASWDTWQNSANTGIFSMDTHERPDGGLSAKVQGVDKGCFIHSCPVIVGSWYAVEASGLIKGTGTQSVIVRWKDSSGNWVRQMKDREIYFTGHKSEWRKAFGVVAVPDGAAQLVLLLNVREQDPASVCWFDHVEVSKIK